MIWSTKMRAFRDESLGYFFKIDIWQKKLMKIKNSWRSGLSFGLASGVITTLGLTVGLATGTSSRTVVVGGILTIAIADAFSDALGVHISAESQKLSQKKVWETTLASFGTKFVVAMIFIFPVLFLSLVPAVILNALIGMTILSVYSFFLARSRGDKPIWVILEHLGIGIFVIAATYFVGFGIAKYLG